MEQLVHLVGALTLMLAAFVVLLLLAVWIADRAAEWIVGCLDKRRNLEAFWLGVERQFGSETVRKMKYHVDGYRCGHCPGCRQEVMWAWRRGFRFRAEMDSIVVPTLRDEYLGFLLKIGVSNGVFESAYNWSSRWAKWAGGVCG